MCISRVSPGGLCYTEAVFGALGARPETRVDIPFLKHFKFSSLRNSFGRGSIRFVGIDIGSDSAKVVQLRKERERAILETYGELKTGHYFAKDSLAAGSFLGAADETLVNILTDIMREAKITATSAVFPLPAAASFLPVPPPPLVDRDEIAAAIPFEAKKYIPIPIKEVTLDWDVVGESKEEKRVDVLLAAVPTELITKYQHVAGLARLSLDAVEIESFCLARALLAGERGVSAIINWGAVVATLTIVDHERIQANHNFGRGSFEITNALSQALGVNLERAEAMKREIGLSEKPEDRPPAGIITPIVDAAFADYDRAMTAYNRASARHIERIVLNGGGANLAGLVGDTAKRFGVAATIGNPFSRTVTPEFLQSVLNDIAPHFAVATGAALRPFGPS